MYRDKTTGNWFVSYTVNGKRYRRSLRTKNTKNAKTMASTIDFLERGLPVESSVRKLLPGKIQADFMPLDTHYLTLYDLQEEFLAAKKATTAFRSFTSYEEKIVLIRRFLDGNGLLSIKAADFDKRLLDRFVTWRKEQKRSNVTVNNDLIFIASIFNWAIKRNLVTENPIKGFDRLPEEENEPVCLEPWEVAAIIENASQKAKPIIILMAYTGIRKGEAARLEWCDIDFRRKVLKVANKKNKSTKSGRDRVVPLHEAAIQMLKALPREAKNVFPYLPDDYNNRYFRNYLREEFLKAAKKGGIQIDRGRRNVTLKSLRSTFTSLLAESGARIEDVQEWLGHRSIETTRKHYLKVQALKHRDVISNLSFHTTTDESEAE